MICDENKNIDFKFFKHNLSKFEHEFEITIIYNNIKNFLIILY